MRAHLVSREVVCVARRLDLNSVRARNVLLGAALVVSAALFGASLVDAAGAQEYSASKLAEAAPADELSPEVADKLAATGTRVTRGLRGVCDIWLCQEWPAAEGFQPTTEILYPFTPGQLVGVLRFTRKGGDFREQEIPAGVYTLRYALQPVDGSHVGTSPTRDFLVLVKAEDDRAAGPTETKALFRAAAAAAESNHPAMLYLLKPTPAEAEASPSAETASLRHDEDKDWWIARLPGKTRLGGKSAPLALELVVAGHAAE